MKKVLILLFITVNVLGQINSLSVSDGSITITPKGLQSKFSRGTNSELNTSIGNNALRNNNFGTDIIAIGNNAHFTSNGGTSNYSVKNIAIGNGALFKAQPSQSGSFAISGRDNIAMGTNALYQNLIGSYNIAIGNEALSENTGSFNTAMGNASLTTNSTGYNNSSFGYFSMYSNLKGHSNSGFGTYSLYQNTNANYNTAIGYSALKTQNFANGGNTYNSENVAVGFNSLSLNNPTATTNGIKNTAIGSNSMYNNIVGANNTAIGAYALYSNTYSSNNVAIGESALKSQTFVNNNIVFDGSNVAVGVNALFTNNPTTDGNGTNNTAIGGDALKSNTTGFSNAALGRNSLLKNQNGNFNSALGKNALSENISGSENVALGDFACASCIGNKNVVIGNEAGFYETGSDKLYIENSNSTNPLIGGNFITDVVGINMPITSLASNTSWKLQVGGDINATGSVRAAGVVLTSDQRFKKNIQPIATPLNAVNELNGYSYNWRTNEYPDRNFSEKPQMGLIAQEVEKIFPELVDTDTNGYKSVNYLQLTPLMIEAIKELKKENDALKTKNQTLESRLDKIEALLSTIQPNTELLNSNK